jgi:hypothetical protein
LSIKEHQDLTKLAFHNTLQTMKIHGASIFVLSTKQKNIEGENDHIRLPIGDTQAAKQK